MVGYWLYWLVKGGYPAPLPCCPEDWTLLTAPIHHPDLHRETDTIRETKAGSIGHTNQTTGQIKNISLTNTHTVTRTKLMSHIHFLFYMKKIFFHKVFGQMKPTLIRLNNWSIRHADFLFHYKAKEWKLYLFDADAIRRVLKECVMIYIQKVVGNLSLFVFIGRKNKLGFS